MKIFVHLYRISMPQFLAFVVFMALLSPGTAQDSVDTLTWTNMEDLREGAFTVDVPAGWQVEGGLFRFSSFDTRPMVRVTSPDGGIVIIRGDYSVPGFEIPTAASESLGYSEGQSLHPGSMLLQYMTGEEFGGWYVNGMNGMLPSENIPAILQSAAPISISLTVRTGPIYPTSTAMHIQE